MAIVIADNIGGTGQLIELDDNGENPITLVNDMGGFLYTCSLEYDPITQQFFWLAGNGNIWKCNRDGNESTILLDLATPIYGIGIDSVNSFIFYLYGSPLKIARVNIDGTGNTDLSTTGGNSVCIQTNSENSKIYVAYSDSDTISQFNYEGDDRTELVTGILDPTSFRLDVSGGKLYTGSSSYYKICSALLAGGAPTTLYTSTGYILGIGLDINEEKIYFIDGATSPRYIKRMNFDGSNIEILYTDATMPVQLIYLSEESASGINTSGNLLIRSHQYMTSYWCPTNWAKRIR